MTKPVVLTVSAICAFALAWSGFVHGLVLREAETVLDGLVRPAADRSLPPALLLTVAVALLFTLSHGLLVRPAGLRQGLAHGACFGVLAGLLVDLNQYLLYPIPGSLAMRWFLCGMFEFCVYGLIASLLWPVTTVADRS